MIVIYDYNANGLYYKTTILTNFALATNVNYDRKVRFELKCTFTIINYDSKSF